MLNEGLEQIEIIVINNASSEKSGDVVQSYKGRLPIRYIYHDKPGLGEVRNRSWLESKADWVAYLDDDSIPSKNWLESALASIKQVENDCFFIAGNVTGLEKVKLPKWCHHIVAEKGFSNTCFGTIDKKIDYPDCPLGNNMILRRSHLEEIGGFHSELRTFDETYVCLKGYWKGRYGYFSAMMEVSHPPSPERITKSWLSKKYRISGRCYQIAIQDLKRYSKCPSAYNFLKRSPILIIKILIFKILRKPASAFACKMELMFDLGRTESFFMGSKPFEYSN